MTSGASECSYVYGPVPSRRLGRSLGLDLVPFKTCTHDCVYCQLGRTTNKTIERREYVPTAQVLAELERTLSSVDAPDYITLAGSGEPTLNSHIGRIIRAVKQMTPIPVAVITNGSLLWMDGLQGELMPADLVIPSLDAGEASLFRRINRSHPAISFDAMVQGLAAFTARFPGQVWLEVMLLEGLNDSPAATERIAALVGDISPARTQLNTAIRPPAEDFVRPLTEERMREVATLFPGDVDIICDFAHSKHPGAISAGDAGARTDAEILALLKRRPCTVADIAAGLGLHVLDVLKHLDVLCSQARVSVVRMDQKTFYVPGAGFGADVPRGAPAPRRLDSAGE